MANDQLTQAAATAIAQAINNLSQSVNNKFPNWVAVPATATSTGVAGQVAYSTTHFYICVSANLWRRVSIGAF